MGANQSTNHGKAVIIAPSTNENESPIMVNSHILEENGGKLMSTLRGLPECKTTTSLLRQSTIKHAEYNCVGERKVCFQIL